MGATTFDKEQLDAMGTISLDEFASCLSIALAPARASMERTLAPLARALLASTATPALSELSHAKGECTVATPVAAPAAAGIVVAVAAVVAVHGAAGVHRPAARRLQQTAVSHQ